MNRQLGTTAQGGNVPARPPLGLRTLAVAAAATVVIVAAVVVWLLLRGGDEKAPPASRARATVASIQQLRTLARSVGHPLYWAGRQPRYRYELSRTSNGGIYVRYLPPGAEVGSPNPDYLTVGTYPQPAAFAALRSTASKQGSRTIRLAGGGVAFQHKTRPTNVYLAYPSSDVQIEVYDPIPGRARLLVLSGHITPIR
jgi:hypothetical protein